MLDALLVGPPLPWPRRSDRRPKGRLPRSAAQPTGLEA